MTDELIRTLAEKLDIAVDGAASWLQMAIPQYCQMKAFSNGVNCFVLFVLFCLFAVCAARSIEKYKQLKKKEEHEEKEWWRSAYEWSGSDKFCALFVIFCILAILVFILFSWSLVDAISWGFFPDAMVLSTLISKC